MMNPLDALVIVFLVMSVISVIGLILLYLAKNEKIKKGIFYFLTIWGMVIAWCNAAGIPDGWFGEIVLAWILGGLSIAALLFQLCTKGEHRFKIARILVTVSVIAGMVDTFML
ncbi:MAG: hypothetical protein IJP31_04350 [Lachnospiraceae bacterium]|nr:hypothetical protein [Lachnospiraceae bacterium]